MQDVHSIGGGRLFGGGDRRLRPHHHQNHQALKCPRCDSLNTKFCYFNNYNLSQPRHFCKSCRRYWTKGGVLRNVPIGGGCRKTKRSKPKSSSSDTTAAPPPPHDRKSLSHSSSESSSLTATTTAAATTNTTEAVSGLSAPSGSSTEKFLNIHDSKHFSVHSGNPNPNPSFESTLLEQGSDNGIFSEIGSFTSLITSSTESLAFGFSNISDISGFRLNHQNQWPPQPQQQQQKMVGLGGEELKMQEIAGGMIDQTVQAELSALQSRSNAGFGSLDWQASGDHHGLFDIPNAVDQQYWSQSQWATDQDHPSLYLP